MLQRPLPEEIFWTGCVCCSMLAVVLFVSCFCVLLAIKESCFSLRTFVSVMIFCAALLDVVTYSFFIIDSSLTSIVGFAFRILSTTFFWLSFMLVCSCWLDMLSVKDWLAYIYNQHTLLCVALLVATFNIVSFVACLQSNDFSEFAYGSVFPVFVGLNVVLIIFFSSSLCVFGYKLIQELNGTYGEEFIIQPLDQSTTSLKRAIVFKNALTRFTNCIGIVCAVNTVRGIMSAISLSIIAFNLDVTTKIFTLGGFIWCLFIDILPTFAQSLAIVILVNPVNPFSLYNRRRGSDKREILDAELHSFNRSSEERVRALCLYWCGCRICMGDKNSMSDSDDPLAFRHSSWLSGWSHSDDEQFLNSDVYLSPSRGPRNSSDAIVIFPED